MKKGQSLTTTIGAKREGQHAGGTKQRYILDDRGRRLIMERYDGRHETVVELTHLLRVPNWRLHRWAIEMGLALPRRKQPAWTDVEIHYLEKHMATDSLAAIAAHLGRTKTSVQVKAKRIGVNKQGAEYTLRGLCASLGCDHHKVERWLAKGWLHGVRRGSERTEANGGDMWLFTHANIRRFVTEYPEEIDPRRVDWLWIVDLLTGGLGPLE